MWKSRLDDSQVGIKIAWRNVHNLRYADDTTLIVKSEEELKNILMKVKEESEKAGLKLSIQKRSWHPVPSLHGRQMGETVVTVADFIFWAPKSLQMVTAAMKLKDSYSLEGKF